MMETTFSNPQRRDRSLHWGVAAVSAIVLLVLFAVLTARLTGFQPATPELAEISDVRLLEFRDGERGEVEIYDWDSGEPIASFAPGEGSFLRGVMRSLVRQRRGMELSSQTPFTLTRYRDNRLIISDPSTGEHIDLVAFGPDNIAVFEALMPTAAAPGSPAYNSLD